MSAWASIAVRTNYTNASPLTWLCSVYTWYLCHLPNFQYPTSHALLENTDLKKKRREAEREGKREMKGLKERRGKKNEWEWRRNKQKPVSLIQAWAYLCFWCLPCFCFVLDKNFLCFNIHVSNVLHFGESEPSQAKASFFTLTILYSHWLQRHLQWPSCLWTHSAEAKWIWDSDIIPKEVYLDINSMLTFIKSDSYQKAKDSKERDAMRNLLPKTIASKMILTWLHKYTHLLTCTSYPPVIQLVMPIVLLGLQM